MTKWAYEKIDSLEAEAQHMLQEVDRLRAEVERLRETEKKLREVSHSLEDDNAIYFSRNLELEQERDQLKTEIAHLQIEVTNLRGLQPEIPPMPGEDWQKELPRYILRENGSHRPRSVPHKDGYWTPWYLANRLHEELERERKAAKTACENWGDMKRERDQLAVEVAALKPYRDNHHDLIRHMADHDTWLLERFCDYAQTKYRFGLHSLAVEFNQLRQQAEAQPVNESCELECGAYGTYCRCRAEKAKEVHSGGN